MKKSFLVIICVVFVASVVAVGLFGRQQTTFYEVIPPKDFRCELYRYAGETARFKVPTDPGAEYDYQVVLKYQKGTEEISFEIAPPVFEPTDTTDKTCSFYAVGNEVGKPPEGVTVTDDGIVTVQLGKRKTMLFPVVVYSNAVTSLQKTIYVTIVPG